LCLEPAPAPVKEVVYENNPYLVQQVEKFQAEMKRAQKDEADARKTITAREEEITRLRSLIDKLRNGIMDFKSDYGSEHKVDNKNITHYVMNIRSKMIDDVLTFNKQQNSKLVKELCFRILVQNRALKKAQKKYQVFKQDRIETLQKAKKENPLFVWSFIRERLVDWLFEIFCRSNDGVDKKKGNSFLIFKINMEEIARSERSFLELILPAYI
jgi:polyhydroxyalkanoate synthesis regulator phasin